MSDDGAALEPHGSPVSEAPGGAPGKRLTPAAKRALAEAEDRRRAAPSSSAPPEAGGPGGPEPTRFGDWERKGVAVDF